jgi:hypothetical protein
MPFNEETALIAGQKSKRGKAKKLVPNIKEKMEPLYEEVLDHLIMHQDELSNADRVRLVQSLSFTYYLRLNLFETNYPRRN